jgi:hypothetical protein
MDAPHVETMENGLVFDFESLDDAMRLLSPWRAPAARADAAWQIHRALGAAGLRLQIRVNGTTVAEMGQGVFRGSLLNLLRAGCD